MKCIEVCLAPLHRRVVLPHDSADMASRKKILTAAYTFVFLFLLLAMINSYAFYSPGWRMQFISMHLGVFSSGFGLVWLLTMRTAPDWLIFFTMGLHLIQIVMLDWSTAAGNENRLWQFVVLLIDITLVVNLKRVYSDIMIVVVSLWLTLVGIESCVRFGLFDAPTLPPHDERILKTDCSNPPCAVSAYVGVFDILGYVLIFSLDYYFTKGFADQVREEKDTMMASIQVTQRIAMNLAAFDLTHAEVDLSLHGGSLPPDLVAVLSDILNNLKMYKPYLPQSCLPETQDYTPTEPSDTSVSNSVKSALSSSMQTASGISSMTVTTATRDSVAGCVVVPVAQIEKVFEKKRGGLIVFNIQKTHQTIAENPMKYLGAHAKVLNAILSASRAAKGVLETFEGDKMTVSFNASKRCPSYAVSAARVAGIVVSQIKKTREVLVNAGTSCGSFFGGDMGCAEVKRYSIIGELVPLTHKMERLGRKHDVPVLCTTSIHSDASYSFPFRIWLKKVVRQEKSTVFYELLEQEKPEEEHLYSPAAPLETRDAEWMYSLEKGTDTYWAKFNVICKDLLTLEESDASVVLDNVKNQVSALNDEKGAMFAHLMRSLPLETVYV